MTTLTTDLSAWLAAPAREAPESKIVEIFNYARGRENVLPLWVGEGDLPTPSFISEAATRSLAAGETFYTAQRGIPELREALARYHERLLGRPLAAERFHITIGGMQALQIAIRMVAEAGDEVLVPTPAWPNFAAAIGVGGAVAVSVPMTFGNAGWTLDFERLETAIGSRTKALVINSPSNPTGWTASREDLAAILDLARRKNLWIIADEVYTRFVYGDAPRAPSFHDVATDEDRILYPNTFSKNWAMTGWRIGWLEAHPSLGPAIENLIQYSTSGVATFMQRAAIAALDRGEGFVEHQIARAKRGRDIMVDALRSTGRVRFAEPDGAFYLFAKIDGFTDTNRLALQLVDETGVGPAPGTAFGPGGEDFLRICFARSEGDITEAAGRLADWIGRAQPARPAA
jgi:aspartate/methionine/tyrosine aminotransferase